MANPKYTEWLTPEGLVLLEGWARDGLTDEQIAKNMGVATKTLYNWRKAHVPILQALKKGKAVVDFEVENALVKRALGYSYDEVTQELRDGELTITKIVSKEVAPDVGAAAFWLKNRQRDKYRDRWDSVDNDQSDGTGVIVIPEVEANG